MKKKIAIIMSVLVMFGSVFSVSAFDKTTVNSLVNQLSGYDYQTRKALFENLAVFSGAKENLEMVCEQIDAKQGMVYDMLKPMIEKMGDNVTKAMLRSIASLGCSNMKASFYAIADAKTAPEPIALSAGAKEGMGVMLNVIKENSPEMGAMMTEDGVNESVLAYVIKNMLLNTGNGAVFKYDNGSAMFSVRAISDTFASDFNAVWQGVSLGDETMNADKLLGGMVDLFNSHISGSDGIKLAKALSELGLCESNVKTEGESTGGGSGNGGAPGIGEGADTQTPAGKFTDLANYQWAEEAIYSLREKGIINGTSKTEFSPANNIKRGDFILILTRMLNITGGSDNFADVPSGSYYYNAIQAAKAAGIAKGDGDRFMPDNTITRQDLITLAYRAFLNKGYIKAVLDTSTLEVFSDKDMIADYAKEAMASMVSAGIIKGSDGGVNPKGFATRAEVAVMCARLADLMG